MEDVTAVSRDYHDATGAHHRRDGADRRRLARGVTQGEPTRSQLTMLILGTYREMPGLSLNLQQAARLFGLRETTCRVVLDDLVHAQRIRRAGGGQYVAHPGAMTG